MMQITDALKEIKAKDKRKFMQTIDLAINLQDIDVKKPENKFVEEVIIPSGRGKSASVGVIGNTLAMKAKGVADELIDEAKLSQIEADKKLLRKVVKKCDFLIAEAPLMLRIGKSLGKVLGPIGKMPKPIPPQADPKDMINKLKTTVKIRVADNPVVHCPIGTEKMSDEDLMKNFEAVLQALEKRLPKGKLNIRSAYIKTTMSPAVKIDLK